MNKAFIPYKEALALTKLGFAGGAMGLYYEKGKRLYYGTGSFPSMRHENILAPLYSEAFRWFREEHSLDYVIEPRWEYPKADKKYCVDIIDLEDESETRKDGDIYYSDFDTYEEAEIAGLRKLIEIVKENKDE